MAKYFKQFNKTKQFILDAYKQLRIQPGMMGYASLFIDKATMNIKSQKNGKRLYGSSKSILSLLSNQ